MRCMSTSRHSTSQSSVAGLQPLVLLVSHLEGVSSSIFICALPNLTKIALGLSFKSSQYGLAIDTVQAFELVLPNGTVTTVTADNEDLFFGLKVFCLFLT